MATALLVEKEIQLGRELVEALDEAGIPVSAAFWLQEEEPQQWRLMLATKLVPDKGPRYTYRKVQTVMQATGIMEDLPLWRISVIAPKHPVARVLASAFKTKGKQLGNVHLDDCFINGTAIPGAHIYRS